MSFAFSLKSFICEGSSQMLCHEAYSSKRSITGAGGHKVWPLWASSLPGLPLQAPSCPRQLHFGRGGGESIEAYPARVGTGPLVPGSVFRKHSSDSGRRAPRSKHATSSTRQGSPNAHGQGGQLCQVENRSVGFKPCDSLLRIGGEGSSEVLCYNPALYS